MAEKNISLRTVVAPSSPASKKAVARKICFVSRKHNYRTGFLKITEKSGGRSCTTLVPLEACAELIMRALSLLPHPIAPSK